MPQTEPLFPGRFSTGAVAATRTSCPQSKINVELISCRTSSHALQQRRADIEPGSLQALRERHRKRRHDLAGRIGEVGRAVQRVRVEVGVAAAEANWVLAQEPLPRRIVVPGPIEQQSGAIV